MFENAMIESNKRKLVRKTKWYFSTPISIIAHIIVIGLIIFTNLWEIEAVAEPPIQVFLFSSPPPPPPPPAPPKPKAQPEKPKEPKPEEVKVEKPVIKTPVQPIAIPEELPPEKTAPEEEIVTGGEGIDGGVEGGMEGGVEGGIIGGEKVPEEEPPVRITSEITRPELIEKVEPAYPEIARKMGTQGMVILEAIISKTGEVRDVRVLKSVGSEILDKSAVDAVLKWRYKPALLNGKPISVYLSVTVQFRLSQ